MFFTPIALAIIIIVVLAVVFFGILTVKTGRAGGEAVDPRSEQLRYPVPDGQDPAVLLSALGQAGYKAAADTVEGKPYVVVECPAGRERERAHVRQAIRDAGSTSMEGPAFEPREVTFDDER
ncbi:MAG TPA: hypothetical protein VF049_17120 [Nocardioidaceae bacterium]|jgi:hypothetical protein